jgi:hypothetical protein
MEDNADTRADQRPEPRREIRIPAMTQSVASGAWLLLRGEVLDRWLTDDEFAAVVSRQVVGLASVLSGSHD